MVAIIVAAVLGAVFGVLTTASLKWGRAALAAVIARVRPDHKSLHGGGPWMLPQSVSAGKPCSVRVLVACAPARHLGAVEIDPDLAIPFLRNSFPGMFPDEPAFSLPIEGIRFTVADQGSPGDGYAWAWKNGRLDLASTCPWKPGRISGS
jgi:hypothetical protein